MTLAELAFACYLYGKLNEYDRPYNWFRDVTEGAPNMDEPEHREALLVLLNRWGCRQFAQEYYEHASKELFSWHTKAFAMLPDKDKNLWDLTPQELNQMGTVFESLVDHIASYKEMDGRSFAIRVGPAAAAKIIFVLGPRAAAPWDDETREGLGFNGSTVSYTSYLRSVKSMIEGIEKTCRRHALVLENLPKMLQRPNSTMPKLIEEYYWVTVSKGCALPKETVFQNWAQWAR